MDNNTELPYSSGLENSLEMDYITTKSNKKYYTKQEVKPLYLTNSELLCGIIEYGDKKYYFDFEDRDKIINFEKKFVFFSENDIYPSFNYNSNRINYIEFLYGFKQNGNVNYNFRNGNIFDLRKCNVDCFHCFHENITKKYSIKEYIPGHYSKNGVDPYFMKNPLWKIEENEKEYLLMYCKKKTIYKISKKNYKKILDFEKNEKKKITWFKLQNGYVIGNGLYMHQIITDCYGNGKGTLTVSVDHIDRDPLNNTIENLRVATRKEQENNCKGIMDGTKRERKTSAKPLPQGITQQMMKKYVVYYHEWLDKEKTRSREFFKIEKHPKLDKMWVGTKSNKVSISEKLQQVNKVVDDLENDIYP